MGYLIAYFLLVLAVDLVCKARQPAALNKTVVVRRRLWNDSNFDCYSINSSSGELHFDPNSGKNCWTGLYQKTKILF